MRKLLAVFIFCLALFGLSIGGQEASAASNTSDLDISDNLVVNELQYDINKNLSPEEIAMRFEKINTSYEVGEPFSLEDSEFVKYYAVSQSKSTDTNMQRASLYNPGGTISKHFSNAKYQYGAGVSIDGKVRTTMGYINHSYGGTFSTFVQSGRSNVKSIKNVVTHSAYGVLGTSGTYVGKVHSSSISSTSGSRPSSWSISEDKEYSAVGVMYTYTNAYAKVTTTSGTFTLYAF
jgi:hypothetical protein